MNFEIYISVDSIYAFPAVDVCERLGLEPKNINGGKATFYITLEEARPYRSLFRIGYRYELLVTPEQLTKEMLVVQKFTYNINERALQDAWKSLMPTPTPDY